jgi:serine/threonine protein kinase
MRQNDQADAVGCSVGLRRDCRILRYRPPSVAHRHLAPFCTLRFRYLHSKGIVHRDLKVSHTAMLRRVPSRQLTAFSRSRFVLVQLENFLFSAPGPDSELKMIDFGFSKHFEVGQCHCERVGTPYTVAPEIIKGNYDEKCDIWCTCECITCCLWG